jgi:hypothetical protein
MSNYLYDGSNSVAEMDAAGALLARYTQDSPTAKRKLASA